MQFTYAALAVLATTVLADSTVYMTEEVTITSCASSVTVSTSNTSKKHINDENPS